MLYVFLFVSAWVISIDPTSGSLVLSSDAKSDDDLIKDGLSDTVGFSPPAFLFEFLFFSLSLFDFLMFLSLLKFSVGAYCLPSQLDPLPY